MWMRMLMWVVWLLLRRRVVLIDDTSCRRILPQDTTVHHIRRLTWWRLGNVGNSVQLLGGLNSIHGRCCRGCWEGCKAVSVASTVPNRARLEVVMPSGG